MTQFFGVLRRFSVVQRQRIILILDNDLRRDNVRAQKTLAEFEWQRFCPEMCLAIVHAHLGAVPPYRRQVQRRNQSVEIAYRPSAHKSERTSRLLE